MMLLYKCQCSISTLDQLRHLKFIEKVTASASYVEFKIPPPISSAYSLGTKIARNILGPVELARGQVVLTGLQLIFSGLMIWKIMNIYEY